MHFADATEEEPQLACIRILHDFRIDRVFDVRLFAARNDMQNKNWTSAITRLQSVVSTAQETVMTPEAMFRLTECYTAIGLPDQAEGYAKMLRANFPDNEWTKKLK